MNEPKGRGAAWTQQRERARRECGAMQGEWGGGRGSGSEQEVEREHHGKP